MCVSCTVPTSGNLHNTREIHVTRHACEVGVMRVLYVCSLAGVGLESRV